MKIEMRDPADLRIHPLRKRMEMDGRDEQGWNAFVDAMSGAGAGGIPPIFITAEGEIMDGKRRYQAARQLQWRELACVVRPEEECGVLMVESLMGQRHLTKGAKVYLTLGFLEDFARSAEYRRVQNLKKGVKTLEKPISSAERTKLPGRPAKADGVRVLAEKLGCGHTLIAQAFDLRERLEKDVHAREFWEGRIFDAVHPVGIGAAIAGLEGGRTEQDHFQPDKQLDLFADAVTTFSKRFDYWRGFDEAARRRVMAEIRDQVIAELEPDEAAEMADFLTKLAGEARQRSKAVLKAA